MLRITKLAESPTSVTLRVEGQIISEWVSVLEEESRTVVHEGRWLVLDFSEVTFIDRNGVKMLKKMATQKVQIINCSPLIQDLLKKR